MDLQYLGKRLRSLRQKRQESLSQVSNALSMDKSYLSKLENGSRKPSQALLNSILSYYELGYQDYSEFLNLAGYPPISSHVNTQVNKLGKEVFIMQDQEPGISQSEAQITVPNNLPVLYSDSIYVTASNYGLVFDFGQKMGPTNQVNVVTRIGLSKEHAEALLKVLTGKIKDMQLLTKKTDKKDD